MIILNYYNIFKERRHKIGKVCVEYEPSKEIGWSGPKFQEHLIQKWENVKSNLKLGNKLYIHAFSDIIMDEKEKNLVDYSVIKFKDEFYKKAEYILGDNSNVVGVHIRRTDYAFCIDTNKTEFFVKKIEEILEKEPSIRFFLSTDDKNEEDKLCGLWGDKIIVQKDKKWGRDTTDGMESGIVDLLCLAKCKYILGCTSTFSFFASRYGKKELIICKEEENV